MARGLTLTLESPDGRQRRVIGRLEWPEALDAEALAFVRDNLLAERVGDSRKAAALLEKGRVTSAERARFLAEKPFFPPEPPARLASELDLEDLVAEFAVALRALREADPAADLILSLA